MNLLNWIPGRQGTGYRKLCLWQGKSSDCYIIDYPVGSYVPPHTDPVAGKEHHRVNVRLCGEQSFEATIYPYQNSPMHLVKLWWRVIRFRPDLVQHEVHVSHRRRVILSFGWVKPA